MRKSLLNILVDPVSKKPLDLHIHKEDTENNIIEGTFVSSSGESYPIISGIPRFVTTADIGQRQTEGSFAFKWKDKNVHKTPTTHYRQWLAQKYGFNTLKGMQDYFRARECILDIGCGNGYSSMVWLESQWQGDCKGQWCGADISSAIDVAQEQLGMIPGTHFIQADLMGLPFGEKTFDTIFSEGVLHHTPSTERALKNVSKYLKPGGEILFYVYREKGPIREFTDDYIRELVSHLPPNDAWEMLLPLTRLGKALAELNVEVEVPEDIPYLGIKAGCYDVQRLIYWNFAKMFWNPEYTFEECHGTNFDWYHPSYAHRQTEEEVRRWCAEANLSIFHFHVQKSGFTVRARRS